MVAPDYASARSELARTMGLGRKGGSSLSDAPEPTGDSPETAPEASSERKPKIAARGRRVALGKRARRCLSQARRRKRRAVGGTVLGIRPIHEADAVVRFEAHFLRWIGS